MKVLLLYKSHTPIPQDAMWQALERKCHLDRIGFGKREMRHYAGALAPIDFQSYDRVLLDQNIRLIGSQYPALRQIPNLVFLEQDSCQHFVPQSKWYGKYDVVFRDIGTLRVLVSNRTCETAFRQAGLDCAYLPKCCDTTRIRRLDQPRDIEFGHIGRTKHRVYQGRSSLLQTVSRPLGLQLLRTEEGDPDAYNQLLNRIRFFISADIGFHEYMFKNFEAMGAGCVLMAKRQPAIEQEALGFLDMENVVLYDDARELLEKAQQLRGEPNLANCIAQRGYELIQSRHTMSHRADALCELLRPPIRPAPPPSTWEKIRRWWLPRLLLWPARPFCSL